MRPKGYSEPFKLVDQFISYSSAKRVLLIVSLGVLLLAGIITGVKLNTLPPTFNGKVDVAALQKDPEAYDLSQADGAAAVIVAENLAKTDAKNVCFSVVFNFRGYDTMGESFILIAALSGSLCILRNVKKKKTADAEGKEEA